MIKAIKTIKNNENKTAIKIMKKPPQKEILS